MVEVARRVANQNECVTCPCRPSVRPEGGFGAKARYVGTGWCGVVCEKGNGWGLSTHIDVIFSRRVSDCVRKVALRVAGRGGTGRMSSPGRWRRSSRQVRYLRVDPAETCRSPECAQNRPRGDHGAKSSGPPVAWSNWGTWKDRIVRDVPRIFGGPRRTGCPFRVARHAMGSSSAAESGASPESAGAPPVLRRRRGDRPKAVRRLGGRRRGNRDEAGGAGGGGFSVAPDSARRRHPAMMPDCPPPGADGPDGRRPGVVALLCAPE